MINLYTADRKTNGTAGWGASNYPSDGLLAEYTQKLQGIPPGNIYRIQNANHISLLNLSYKGVEGDNTKIQFNLIWDRNPGDFFRTDER